MAAVAYTREDVVRTMTFIASGRVDVRALHTRTVPLAALAETLNQLANGSGAVKVLVDPRSVSD